MSNKNYSEQRSGQRFKPDEANACALIELDFQPHNNQDSPIRTDMVGLIFSQSSGGCGITVRHNEKLKVGNRCRIQVGGNKPQTCEIVWLNVVDDDTIKLGVRYIQ